MTTEFYQELSELDKETRLSEMKQLRDDAWYANLEWLESAQRCHAFKAGDQWTEEEKRKLRAQGRDGLVWNYIHSGVELISGTLAQNPVRIYPYPVERSDDFLCEVLEDLIKYVNENQCNAEVEEVEAFENGVISGIGDVVVDVGPDPANPLELKFDEHCLEAYEVLVDPQSRKQDLSDARYICYEKWVTIEDFKVRYPEHIKDIEDIFTVISPQGIDPDSDSYDGEYTESPFEYYDEQAKRILVTHFEYRVAYKRYYLITEKQESQELNKEEYNSVKKQIRLQGLNSQVIMTYDTKVNWSHFIHDRILWEGESPVYKKNFSLSRMRVYTDKSSRQTKPFGVVKLMIDPQRECNKRWLHSIRLLTSQGVGVMAEADAFVDIEQAQESWNDPDAITFVNKGGLNKIEERKTPEFPSAPIQMEQLNQEAIKKISGINPDLMGHAQQRREPGINLKLRLQQGLTMLAKIYNKYTLMRKEVYKRKLEVIMRFMPDAQIRKILGETEKYTFQQGYIIDQRRGLIAPIRAIRDLNYNVRVEDAPGGMNKTMSELAIMLEMMEKGMPIDPDTIIDKLDISPSEKWDWKTYIKKQEQQEQQAQQQEQQLRGQEIAGKQNEIAAKLDLENRKLAISEKKINKDNRTKYQIAVDRNAQSDLESKRNYAINLAELEKDEQEKAFETLVDLARHGLTGQNNKTIQPLNATPATGRTRISAVK